MTEAAHAQREHMQRVAESTINASITSAQSTLEMANTFTKNNYQAAHALQEAAAAIAMATQAYHLALQEGEQIVSRIAGINASLTESAAQSSVTSARLTDTVSITASQQQMLTLQQKNSQALIVQAEEVFSRLQGGMGGLLTNISTHLADYQRQTQAGLQQNLQSFDTSLGSAVGSLTSVVDALAQELSILETMLHQNRLPEKFEPQP
jgi:hypothetical protein